MLGNMTSDSGWILVNSCGAMGAARAAIASHAVCGRRPIVRAVRGVQMLLYAMREMIKEKWSRTNTVQLVEFQRRHGLGS